ncbi:MAG TPA: DUF1080 domain-containing protein [Candidatus Acidoferrum sp.]|nr:DUF1080 domain-containing protein [Candidatus Acidoferrum sp.]
MKSVSEIGFCSTITMYSRRWLTFLCSAVLVVTLLPAFARVASGGDDLDRSGPDATAAKSFLGRWDLTLKATDREYPSWLEIRLEEGKLVAQMVGRWGNARSLPKVEISDGQVTFVSPKAEEETPDDWLFVGKRDGKTLSGSVTGPKGGPWTWSGVPAPLLQRKRTPKWGKPVSLFNGKDLTGWKMSDPNPTTVWKVENGTLTSPGHGPELINDQKFQDFKLHLEFNCGANANSGVYVRGRYEVQIEDNSIQEPPSHHTGGVYGFLAPTPEQLRKPGEWQTFDITLIGRTITVVQNGSTIIDHKEIPGITGGALDSHEELPGPIYLQGGENNHVAFRNIVITPAK